MISNDQELATTRERVTKLERLLEELRKIDARQSRARYNAANGLFDALKDAKKKSTRKTAH